MCRYVMHSTCVVVKWEHPLTISIVIFNFLWFFQTRIDRLQGADPSALETKVRQHYGPENATEDDGAVAGHVS